jgi:CRISPR-associated protein Cas5t
VLRTLWRVKDKKTPAGNGANASPDFQELVLQAEVLILCSSADEPDPTADTLEARVKAALAAPFSVARHGGWSLGESSHLINDVSVVADDDWGDKATLFVVRQRGSKSLPVWVDHVGSKGTSYVVGEWEQFEAPPAVEFLPQIAPTAS